MSAIRKFAGTVCISAIVAFVGAASVLAANSTPLIDAVKTNDKTAIRALLTKHPDVNLSDVDGMTALHWAVDHDEAEIVELLIRAGANVKASTRYGITSLSLACINGNVKIIEALLKAGADPNTASPEGETVLMTVARTGKPDAVKVLLENGANPNIKEKRRGQTALMWAAADGHAGAVRTLIERGADIHAASNAYFTPLLFAVREGRIDAVKALLDAGADVNENLRTARAGKVVPGPSALVLAVGNAHYELAALLLDRGADSNSAAQGWTALHQISWTRKYGFGDNGPAAKGSGNVNALELVRRLVARGADVNARMTKMPNVNTECGFDLFSCILTDLNMIGATPFLMAARTADVELMRLLVELGADPLIPNVDGTTPLMVAAGVGTRNAREDPGSESEVLEAVKLAWQLGNDVNAVDKNGETAFHGAGAKQMPSVVPFLVEKGVNPKIWMQKNKNGWTPLRIAEGIHRVNAFRSSPEVAAELRKAMIAAGVSTEVEPEKVISGATR
jgi:uncharacterized protein